MQFLWRTYSSIDWLLNTAIKASRALACGRRKPVLLFASQKRHLGGSAWSLVVECVGAYIHLCLPLDIFSWEESAVMCLYIHRL
jgi:hypothetical protein